MPSAFVGEAGPPSANYAPGSACSARSSKRAYSLINVSGMSPVGPLRCLAMISVVLPAARLERERAEKARKQTNLAEFSGTLRLAEDPLAWQQRLRAEWA